MTILRVAIAKNILQVLCLTCLLCRDEVYGAGKTEGVWRVCGLGG